MQHSVLLKCFLPLLILGILKRRVWYVSTFIVELFKKQRPQFDAKGLLRILHASLLPKDTNRVYFHVLWLKIT